jgi:nitrate/TMAO reductase-like tetraheme cytochrome c subunit
MALKSKNQKCQDCHTKTVAAPMKTKAQAAFHDAMAKKGTCIDCHAKEVAAGKKAPLKCNECHTVKG